MILNLMRASESGQAGEAEFAATIKGHLREVGPAFAKPDWEAGEDDPTELRSLSRLLLAARDRDQEARAAYMAGAKVKSVLLRSIEDNEERRRMGFPPLTFRLQAGADHDLGRRRGDDADRLPGDRPRLGLRGEHAGHRHDHGGEQLRGPLGLPPLPARVEGRGRPAHQAPDALRAVLDREDDRRLERRRRAARPHARVDAEANLPRTPLTIKSTYAKTVSWSCADPRHKPYRMSPRARVKVPPGAPACPDCKKMRPKAIPTTTVIPLDDELDLPF